MKKIITLALAALMVAFAFAACVNEEANGPPKTGKPADYIVPDYSAADLVYEILAADAELLTPYDNHSVKDLADAGFTLVYQNRINYATNRQFTLDLAAAAANAGFKLVAGDTDLADPTWTGSGLNKPSSTKNMQYYKNDPTCWGIFICDEPQANKFLLIKEKYDLLKANCPDKAGWLNLCPMGYFPYDPYVREFMETVKPEILSYDNYALFADGTMKDNYLANIETIKYAALEYGAKASNFVLAIQHTNATEGVTYADITEETLRWQLACNMVYGYDMAAYYTYGTPDSNPNAWVYSPGIIDRQGNKTDIYGYAQTVNGEVHAWEKTYMSFVGGWEGVSAINVGSLNWRIVALKNSLKPNEISGIEDIQASEDILVGVFKDAAQNKGFMVTNASNPLDESPAEFTVQFDKAYKGVQVFEKGVPTVYVLSGNGKITLGLEPGEGKFLIPLKKK